MAFHGHSAKEQVHSESTGLWFGYGKFQRYISDKNFNKDPISFSRDMSQTTGTCPISQCCLLNNSLKNPRHMVRMLTPEPRHGQRVTVWSVRWRCNVFTTTLP